MKARDLDHDMLLSAARTMINMYQPQVEGTEYLGTFTLPKKKGRK